MKAEKTDQEPPFYAGLTQTDIVKLKRLMVLYDIPDVAALEAILRNKRKVDEREHVEWLKDQIERVFGHD